MNHSANCANTLTHASRDGTVTVLYAKPGTVAVFRQNFSESNWQSALVICDCTRAQLVHFNRRNGSHSKSDRLGQALVLRVRTEDLALHARTVGEKTLQFSCGYSACYI